MRLCDKWFLEFQDEITKTSLEMVRGNIVYAIHWLENSGEPVGKLKILLSK